jgi:hypothetical protein
LQQVGDNLYTGGEDDAGRGRMQRIKLRREGLDPREITGLPAVVTTIAVLPDDRVAVGLADGHVATWDPSAGANRWCSEPRHEAAASSLKRASLPSALRSAARQERISQTHAGAGTVGRVSGRQGQAVDQGKGRNLLVGINQMHAAPRRQDSSVHSLNQCPPPALTRGLQRSCACAGERALKPESPDVQPLRFGRVGLRAL